MGIRDMFTTYKTEPPQLGLWYFVLLELVFAIIWLSYRYYNRKPYQRLFIGMQACQLIGLYSWYMLTAASLSESLPFYHCRMAMFALMFLPNRSVYKFYFALLGTFGSIVAFIYPIFDPYPFPHITILSFIIGHLALLGNCLIYLFRYYHTFSMSWQRVVWTTFMINAFLLVINMLTKGSYGFLTDPPLVGNHGLLLNYLLVSIVLSAAVCLVSENFKRVEQTKTVTLT
mgnify:FL=1